MREITLLVKDDVTFNALQSLYSTTSSSAIEIISVNDKSVTVQEPVIKRYLVTFIGFDFELTVELDSSDDDEAVVEKLADQKVYGAIGHHPLDFSHEVEVKEVVVL